MRPQNDTRGKYYARQGVPQVVTWALTMSHVTAVAVLRVKEWMVYYLTTSKKYPKGSLFKSIKVCRTEASWEVLGTFYEVFL